MDPDGVLGRARLPLDRSDHCSSSIAVWSFSAKMTTKTFHYDYLIIWAVFDYCSFAALSRLTFTGICQQPQRVHFTGGADPRDQSPTRESQGITLRSYGAARRICCCHPARRRVPNLLIMFFKYCSRRKFTILVFKNLLCLPE